jgi:SAM-dependent methyltransferase
VRSTMRPSQCDLLCCPECQGVLTLRADRFQGDEAIDGDLLCGCGRAWPLRGGVPRFVDQPADEDTRRTARAFGWEWQVFSEVATHHEQQFLDWIRPAGPASFRDRIVLEAGCGKGRHTTLVAGWGARAVIGIDLSDAVDVAFANTRHQPNALIVQGDLRRLPLRARSVDHAFSVGVLHHLPDPEGGFRSMARAVRPGGGLSVWVYGAEHNGWIQSIVSPLRTVVTSRLPPPALYPLSWLAAVPLWIALRLLYGPAARRPHARWGAWLPYGEYCGYISRFPFREIHHIVHDHLAAPVAHYVPRDELELWFERVGASAVKLGWHNQNSWRGCGVAR